MGLVETNPIPDAVVEKDDSLDQITESPTPEPNPEPSGELKSRKDRESEVQPLIEKAARVTGVDDKLLWGVIAGGEGLNPNLSSAGALGYGQLMPATADSLGVKDRSDPEQSIMGAAKYLKQMLEKYNNDPELAVAAYNHGPGNLDADIKRWGDKWRDHLPEETKKYIPNTFAEMQRRGVDQPQGLIDTTNVAPPSPSSHLINPDIPEPLPVSEEPNDSLISRWRKENPQYNTFDDERIMEAIYQKSYAQDPNIPYDRFRQAFLQRWGADESIGLLHEAYHGLAGTVNSIASGIAGFLNEDEENPTFAPGFFKRKAQEYAPSENINRSVLDDPSLVVSPRWWAYQLGAAVPWVAGMAATEGAGAAALGGLGTSLGATELAANIAARAGGGIVSGAAMALVNSGNVYQEAIDEGRSHEEAKQIAEDNFKVSIPINAIGQAIMAGKLFKNMKTEGQLITSNMLKKTTGSIIKDIGQSSLAMMAQMDLQTIANNASLDRPWYQGLGDVTAESSLIGAAFGATHEAWGGLGRAAARSIDLQLKTDFTRSMREKYSAQPDYKLLSEHLLDPSNAEELAAEVAKRKAARTEQINSWDDDTVKEELYAMRRDFVDMMPKDFVQALTGLEESMRKDGGTDRDVLRELSMHYSDLMDEDKIRNAAIQKINDARPRDAVDIAKAATDVASSEDIGAQIKDLGLMEKDARKVYKFNELFGRVPTKLEWEQIQKHGLDFVTKQVDKAGGANLTKMLSILDEGQRKVMNIIFDAAARVQGVSAERLMARHFGTVYINRLMGDINFKRFEQESPSGIRKMIEDAGMIPVGIMKHKNGELTFFNHPKTGSTLVMETSTITPESIKAHIAEHEGKYSTQTQAKPERGVFSYDEFLKITGLENGGVDEQMYRDIVNVGKRGVAPSETSNKFLGPRGSTTTMVNNGYKVLQLFTKPMKEGTTNWRKSDISTILHEMAHAGLDLLGPEQRALVEKYFKVSHTDDMTEAQHEEYARHFEQYFMEGKSPVKELHPVFEALKEMMYAVYKGVKNLFDAGYLEQPPSVPPELKTVFDSMFSKEISDRLKTKSHLQDSVLNDYHEEPLVGKKRIGSLKMVTPEDTPLMENKLRSYGYDTITLPATDENGTKFSEIIYVNKGDKNSSEMIKYHIAEREGTIKPVQLRKLLEYRGMDSQEASNTAYAWREQLRKKTYEDWMKNTVRPKRAKEQAKKAVELEDDIAPQAEPLQTAPALGTAPTEGLQSSEMGGTVEGQQKILDPTGAWKEIQKVFDIHNEEGIVAPSGISVRKGQIKGEKIDISKSNTIIRKEIERLRDNTRKDFKPSDLGEANALEHVIKEDVFKVNHEMIYTREGPESDQTFEARKKHVNELHEGLWEISEINAQLKNESDPVKRYSIAKEHKTLLDFLEAPENKDDLDILRADPDYKDLDLYPAMTDEQRLEQYQVLGLTEKQGAKLSDYDIEERIAAQDQPATSTYYQAQGSNQDPNDNIYEVARMVEKLTMDNSMKTWAREIGFHPSQIVEKMRTVLRTVAAPQVLAMTDPMGYGRLWRFKNHLVEMKNNIITRKLEKPEYRSFWLKSEDHQLQVAKVLMDGTTYGVVSDDKSQVIGKPPHESKDYMTKEMLKIAVERELMTPEEATAKDVAQKKAREDYYSREGQIRDRNKTVGKVFTKPEVIGKGYSEEVYNDYRMFRDMFDGTGEDEGLISLWKKAAVMNGVTPNEADLIYSLTGYFPMDRGHGKFSLRFADPTSPTGYSLTRFGSVREAESVRNNMISNGLIDPSDPKSEVLDVNDQLKMNANHINDHDLGMILEEVGDIKTLQAIIDDPKMSEASKKRATHVVDFADELMNAVKARNYASARTIPRGNVGMVVNAASFKDAFETFVNKTASRYTGALGRDQMTAIMSELGASRDFTGGETSAQYTRRMGWAKYAYEDLNNATRYNDPLQNRFWDRLRTGGFLWALGGNISNGIINSTQTLLTLLPEMHSWRPSQLSNTRTFLMAEKEAFKLAFGGELSEDIKSAYPKMSQMIEDLKSKGKLSATLTEEMFVPRSVNEKLRYWATAPQARSETKNRIASVLAGYMMAEDHVIDNAKGNRKLSDELASIANLRDDTLESIALNVPGSVDRAEASRTLIQDISNSLFDGTIGPEERQRIATEFAGHISDKTQFVYGKHNQPRFITSAGIWGNPLKAAYLFKGFTNNYVGWFINSMRNDPDKSFWQNRNHQLVVLAPLLALAGTTGLPFAGDIKNILKTAGVVDTDDELRKLMKSAKYSDVVIKGLPGLLSSDVAPDFSRRIGVGEVLPQGLPQGDLGRGLVSLFMGAPYQMISNFTSQSLKDYTAGNYTRAYQQMLPVFASNFVKAVQLEQSGLQTASGNTLIDKSKIGAGAVAMQAIGLQTMKVTDAREFDQAMRYKEASRISTVQGFNSRMARAIADGDGAEVQEIINDIIRYNKHVTSPEGYYDFNKEKTAIATKISELSSDMGKYTHKSREIQYLQMKTKPLYMR